MRYDDKNVTMRRLTANIEFAHLIKIICVTMILLSEIAYGDSKVNSPTPINASYSNQFTSIRNQIFKEKDYVLAIMPTTYFADARFNIVIVRLKDNDYLVERRSYKIQNTSDNIGKKDYDQLSLKEDRNATGLLTPEVAKQVVKIINMKLGTISYNISTNDNLDSSDFEVYTSDKGRNTFSGLFQSEEIANLFSILAKCSSEDAAERELANKNLIELVEQQESKVYEMFSWKDSEGKWHFSLCNAAKSSLYKREEVLANKNQAQDTVELAILLEKIQIHTIILRNEKDIMVTKNVTVPPIESLHDVELKKVQTICKNKKITLIE